MKKRILTILLSFVLLSGLVSVLPASAAGANTAFGKSALRPPSTALSARRNGARPPTR